MECIDHYKCQGQDALLHAKFIADAIPLKRVSFEEDYWNQVFEPCIREFQSGIHTPNPDVLCNRVIKFDRFIKHCSEQLGVVWIATGHYARIAEYGNDKEIRLFWQPKRFKCISEV